MTANLPLLAKIMEEKNPWTINSLAEIAGSICFMTGITSKRPGT